MEKDEFSSMSLWKMLSTAGMGKTLGEFSTKSLDTPSLIQQCGITLDYSKQGVTNDSLEQLLSLAQSQKLARWIHGFFRGESVNLSENRAALHTMLRAPYSQAVALMGRDMADEVAACLTKMSGFAQQIRQGRWVGHTDEAITDVVNIGVGGSDLGPKMSLKALEPYKNCTLNFHFISDACPSSFEDAVKNLNPETTLFIVSSKSFSTKETLANADKAKQWLGPVNQARRHFIAVTAESGKAYALGFENQLPMWDWVGGRFSLCSAINFSLMLAIGVEGFQDMLQGAWAMDCHFMNADFKHNMPVMLALLGLLNVNFREINSQAILVYNSRLEYFVPYLQQLEMESNGKSVDLKGRPIACETAPIIWGGIGNRAQHAYYQLLAQGTQKVALDFIFDETMTSELSSQFGENMARILSHGQHSFDKYHIEGRLPCNVLKLEKLSPYVLGALVALYEHKVAVQGALWGINSFDQFGVESTKRLKTDVAINEHQEPVCS